MQELVFDDLTPIEIPVKIKGLNYTLREADGEATEQYRNLVVSGMTMTDDGVRKISGVGSVEIFLVSRCLFNEAGQPVSSDTLRRWPGKIIKTLFNKIKEISELDEDEDLESLLKTREKLNKQIERLQKGALKNVPSDTTTGSI